MEMGEKDKPLWMPVGSVRAIIAIMTIASMCYMAVSQAEFVVPDWLISIISAIIGFYFGNRASER